jgi:hypothetical protein
MTRGSVWQYFTGAATLGMHMRESQTPPEPSLPSRAELLCAYGEAMLAAQELVDAMASLLGARRQLEPHDSTELYKIWHEIFTSTAGALRKKLDLPGALGDELQEAVSARNLLAHHYLRDRFYRGGSKTGNADKLRTAAERFRALARRIDNERAEFFRAEGLTNHPVLTPDDMISSAEDMRRWDRNYDPTEDIDVPPEPFEPWEPPRSVGE